MADKKISQLTAATTPLTGTEVLPIVQSGSTVKVSAADITAGRAISASGLTLSGGTTNAVVYLDGSKVATTTTNLAFDGTNLTLGAAAGSAINVGSSAVSTGACGVKVGNGRTGSGNSFVDLIGDATYTSYGLRLLRDNNDNANSFSYLFHRGTGQFEIRTEQAAPILLSTDATERFRISAAGQLASNADGTASAPAITRASDLNTGIYFPAADKVALTAGGTAGATVTNGKVGILTDTPLQTLHVKGALAINGTTTNAHGESTITASFGSFADGTTLEVDIDMLSDCAFLIEFSAKGLNSATGDTAAIRALIKGSKIANDLYDSGVQSVYASRWTAPTITNVAGTNRIKISMANSNSQTFDSFNTVMLKILGSDRAAINSITIV